MVLLHLSFQIFAIQLKFLVSILNILVFSKEGLWYPKVKILPGRKLAISVFYLLTSFFLRIEIYCLSLLMQFP